MFKQKSFRISSLYLECQDSLLKSSGSDAKLTLPVSTKQRNTLYFDVFALYTVYIMVVVYVQTRLHVFPFILIF